MVNGFSEIKSGYSFHNKRINNPMDLALESLNKQYMKALSHLEEYAEYIIKFTNYSINDVVIVDTDLGNHRMCKMLVCPKSCVINGIGILPCDYFIGLEDIHNEEGRLKGWDVIFEIPQKLKVSNMNYKKYKNILNNENINDNMLVKDLLDNKREYYEAERKLGEEINEFIRGVVRSTNPTVDTKGYYIEIKFEERGKYAHDEIVITSVSDYLTDEVIGALCKEYNLKVSYKCIQTGFNVGTNEIDMQSRVFFHYTQDAEIVEMDEDLEEEDVIEEEDDGEE